MNRAIVLLCVVTMFGCRTYAHRARHHAPGLTDLTTPLHHENGDPLRYEQSTEPGSETLLIAAAPYVLGGAGRDTANGELGMELRFERTTSETDELLAEAGFAITAGAGFFQFSDSTIQPGAFYGELNYRFRLGDTFPIDIGVGPALYSGELDAGGQSSLRILGFMLRFRYMANTGTEIMAGFEVPIPFFFSRSR